MYNPTVPLIRLTPKAKQSLPLAIQQHMLRTYLQWYGSGQLRSDPHKAKLAHDARQSGYIIDPTQGGLYPHKALVAPPPKPFVERPVHQPSLKDYAKRAGRGILQAGQDYLTGSGQQTTAFPLAEQHGARYLLAKAAAGIDRMRHHPGAAGQWDALAKQQQAQMVGAIYGPRHDKSAIARTLGSVPADLVDIANGLLVQAPIQAQQEKMKALAGLYNLYAAGGSALVGHKKAALGHLRNVGAIGSQIYNDELTSSGLNPNQPSILTDAATDLGFYTSGNPNNMGGQYAGHIGRNIGQFTTEHPVQQAMNVASVVEPMARIAPFARAGFARLGGHLAEGADIPESVKAAQAKAADTFDSRYTIVKHPNAPKRFPYAIRDNHTRTYLRGSHGIPLVFGTRADAITAIPKENPDLAGKIFTKETFDGKTSEGTGTDAGDYPRDHRGRPVLGEGTDPRTGAGGMGRGREGRGSDAQGGRQGSSQNGQRNTLPPLKKTLIDAQVYTGRGTPVLMVNSRAMAWLRKYVTKDPKTWVRGFSTSPEKVRKIAADAEAEADKLERQSRPFSAGSLRLLARRLNEMADTAAEKGVAIVNGDEKTALRIIDHELVHVGQYKYFKAQKANPRLLPRTTSNRAWNKMVDATIERHPDYATKLYSEVPAAIVSHWDKAGLTLDEAQDLLTDYAADLAKLHPQAPSDVLGHLEGDLRPPLLDDPRAFDRFRGPPFRNISTFLGLPLITQPARTAYPLPVGSSQKSPAMKQHGGASFLQGTASPDKGLIKQASLPPGFVLAMVLQMPGLANLYGMTPEQRRRLLEQFWASERTIA